jgi:hypothetical protein
MPEISFNGWPASKDRAAIGIKSYAVPGTTLYIACAEKVAPLLVNFAADFHRIIEPIDGGTLDDWSYCYRNIRGSTDKLSNHSSGTALDLNATKHPLGKAGTFDLAKVPMLQGLCRKYGLKWGGDYVNRKDEMHFEIALDAAKVAALITKLDLKNA